MVVLTEFTSTLTPIPHPKSKLVCVIGAGPSGLIAARELRREGHTPVILEQNHDIGGQWLYSQTPSSSQHSSIYQSLRLVSPREIMGFTDFPFSYYQDSRHFPSHVEMHCYLQDFCEKFEVRDFIRFHTKVEYVGMAGFPKDLEEDLRWRVLSRNTQTGSLTEKVYDAVVVANGHYSTPRFPKISGMDAWKRKHLHSHSYRLPESFYDEVVVVIGQSLSGQDISMEVAEVAQEVHLSSTTLENITQGFSKAISKLHNFHLHPQVESIHEDGRVSFHDGACIIADTIIYCTGYSYSFPFLDTKGMVVVDDDRVGPLYEHTFPPSLAPSLSFVGIPRKIIGFPFFEAQAKWIAQVLSGKKRLPSLDEMMYSIELFYQARDAAAIPKHKTHDIADFEYCDKYADCAGAPRVEEWKKEMCLLALKDAELDMEYRDLWDQGDSDVLGRVLKAPNFTQPILPWVVQLLVLVLLLPLAIMIPSVMKATQKKQEQ